VEAFSEVMGFEETNIPMLNHSVPIPLFTEEELGVAFRLILTPDRARRLAHEWFELFGDELHVDENGRYLYSDWRDDLSLPSYVRNAPNPIRTDSDAGEAAMGGMYAWLVSAPPAQLEEVFLSFSDMHLDLLALALPDLRRKVESIRRDRPQISTERRCRDLEAAVNKRRADAATPDYRRE
jgi:hypothetical protein